MCGLVGFLGMAHPEDALSNEVLLKHMADTIVLRGPDDAGYWVDTDCGIGLGHRRLSILDLSHAGHQPMICPTGRYVIAFNGEIYNHLDLRSELAKIGAGGEVTGGWRGRSDTETLLAGFTRWGIKATVERCIGMFAFAVWDRKERLLTLGRDRLGEKPMYYGWQGQGDKACFLFGSELKALNAHPAFEAEINRDALCLLMRYSYIPAPHSIYCGIHKLQPGCLLSISLDRREPVIDTYWSLTKVAVAGNQSPITGKTNTIVDDLESLLRSAVRQQMIADVPLGAFLSGGIDSSTVVALMQAQSERPVKTFTIGFSEEGYNEAVHANAVARYLGTEHTELYVTPEQAMEVISCLPGLYCEPFADSSQIPTFLVSQLARQNVTVSLSGDGGDELFCGYRRYQMTANFWRKLAAVPLPLRKFVASGLTRISPQSWNGLAGVFGGLIHRSARVPNVGDKLHKGAGVLASQSADALFLGLVSHWHDPASVVIGGHEPSTFLTGNVPALDGLDDVQRMMALDMLTYLPDDILSKVDRAAMGVSLETRVPFLDHRVVEFAWNLPQSMKLREGQTKWALRQVLYRYIPQALIERPKMGFGMPIDHWLRGPLRDWAESLLSESRLRSEGFFDAEPIRRKWAEHLSGKRNWQHHLWNVLMFQVWLEHQSS